MDKYIDEYEKRKKILFSIEERQKLTLEKMKQKYNEIQNNPNIDKKELRLNIALINILRASYALEKTLEEKLYLRVGSEELDLEKIEVYRNFARKLKEDNSLDPNLCFHGSRDIASVIKIIESGGLFSSSDRLGFDTSYDVEDQVSVTTLESLNITIEGYSGLTNPSSSRAGAVFVVTPKNEEEIESSRRLIIGNVNFKENPDRLVSIITTNENKDMIIEKCNLNGIDSNKVYTFNEYLQYAKKVGKAK